jgi:sarcosine oxidase
MGADSSYDVAVIGAGVFGAWIALHLARRQQRVLLIEAYGPAHSRASSGGESRIIRMSYGPDEIYTRWSANSLAQWQTLFAEMNEKLFQQTGVLSLAGDDGFTIDASVENLGKYKLRHEVLQQRELESRYPQINFEQVSRGLLEPESGVLLARRAVACTVEAALRKGVELKIAQIQPPRGATLPDFIETTAGERIHAQTFVFACGPWLGKLFPEILGCRIFPTRQQVFFFAVPAGDTRFAAPALPTWLFQADEVYGMPDIESRGLKIACDRHGELIDPEMQSRLASPEAAEWARNYVARRFPALKSSPIVESRVCQYENTSNGDFLIDRHPEYLNVWLVGGGSGHGFKHGPAVGGYTADMLLETGTAEPRFSLATKETTRKRTVH